MNQSDSNRSTRERYGVTTPIHAQLERCIRECDNRTGLKIIVAPSSHAARMLRAALARQGCPLVNVEALTPAELARHVDRTMRPDDRRRTMSTAEGALTVRRLASATDSEAARLLGRAAFPVWAAIQDLRASGVTPADTSRAARRPHERVLAELHAACERHIEETGVRDHANILLSAIDLAEDFASRRPPELLAVLDQVRVSDHEERLIRIISQASGRAVRIGVEGAEWPSDRAATVFSDWASSMDAQGRDGSPADPAAWMIAGERREEVASVLADIVERRRAFDDVEIAYTSPDPYRSEVRAACRRYGIPFTDVDRRPLSFTKVGAAALAALKWVVAGYPVEGLISMLRLGYVRPRRGEAADIAAVLDRFPVSLAAAARPATRDRLFERARQEYVDIAGLTNVFRLLDDLRRIAPGSGRDAGEDLIGFVESFLREQLNADPSTDDVAALIRKELGFLAGSNADTGLRDTAAAAAFAAEVLERLSVPSDGHEGGLSIVPLEDAGYGRAASIYVIGLDDQSCSERSPDDSLLTDTFRRRLRDMTGRGPGVERPLPVSSLVSGLIAGRPDGIVCSRSRYDIAVDRPLFPGIPGTASETDPGVKRSRPGALDVTDSFLNDPTGATQQLAGALFSHIERGQVAAASRASIGWTAFDGVVEPPGDLLREIHSPTALEAMAECPYRYFLRYVLRVPVLESADPDEWMTGRDRGQILHELFERHARRLMEEDGNGLQRDDPDAWVPWFAEQLDDLLERFTASNPAPGVAHLEEARRELLAAGAVYLHAEAEADRLSPYAAEFRFGSDDGADAPPFSLDLDDGHSVALSGRIDRIDVTAEGRLVVTDFKTGKRRGLSESDLRKLDTWLQWALYARLSHEHFGLPVETSGYLFTSVHELGLRREAPPPPAEELDRILREMFERARSGFFARKANPNGDPCTYCDFQAVCGDLAARRDEMRAKACASMEADDDRAGQIETWNGFSRRYCS